MNVRWLAMILFLCTSSAHAAFMDCVFFDGFDGESSAAPTAWKAHVQATNCARKTVDSPAANPPIPPMTWSTSLAQTAQSYAGQCIWAHSGTPGLGENLYAAAPPSAIQTQAAQSWAEEEPNYNYANNSCAAGQQCGHYTQLVWRNTTTFGCGIQNCSTGSPFSGVTNWTIVVCNYSPPGNFTGQRPY